MKEKQYIVIDQEGNKFFFKDKKMTKLHRTDGPAMEFTNSTKQWWVNDMLHRTDGPAVEFDNGYKAWYINDVELTEEQFKSKTQPKISINGKDFTIEELNELIGAAKGK